jgi:A/G-specific adenine glycosylase
MEKKDQLRLAKSFAPRLLEWNREENRRQMPWKGEKDPYRIWLSEIILQQTRVEQGLAYYNRFIETFPNIGTLADSPDQKVFKMWEGLGYYSRCRNLLATARIIAGEMKGKFPQDYQEIKALKGIGPYTAAAIASFAFNLPHAVVDGNVLRVLARLSGSSIPVDTTAGRKHFNALADDLLDKKNPGLYNQAIMDFGATICKPVNPFCGQCVFRKHCNAYLQDRINELPVKEKKMRIKKRWFYFLVIAAKDELVIRRREQKDIWRGLHDFPLIETKSEVPLAKILGEAEKSKWLSKNKYRVSAVSAPFRQQLTHQLITGHFLEIRLKKKIESTDLPVGGEWLWVKKSNLKDHGFPRMLRHYFGP